MSLFMSSESEGKVVKAIVETLQAITALCSRTESLGVGVRVPSGMVMPQPQDAVDAVKRDVRAGRRDAPAK